MVGNYLFLTCEPASSWAWSMSVFCARLFVFLSLCWFFSILWEFNFSSLFTLCKNTVCLSVRQQYVANLYTTMPYPKQIRSLSQSAKGRAEMWSFLTQTLAKWQSMEESKCYFGRQGASGCWKHDGFADVLAWGNLETCRFKNWKSFIQKCTSTPKKGRVPNRGRATIINVRHTKWEGSRHCYFCLETTQFQRNNNNVLL